MAQLSRHRRHGCERGDRPVAFNFYAERMTTTVHLPDELGGRLAAAAASRDMGVDDIAAELSHAQRGRHRPPAGRPPRQAGPWRSPQSARPNVVLEAFTVLGALVLLRRPAAGLVPARAKAQAIVAGVAVLVVGSTGVAVAAPNHAHGSGWEPPARPGRHRRASMPTTTEPTTASSPSLLASSCTSTTVDTSATAPSR